MKNLQANQPKNQDSHASQCGWALQLELHLKEFDQELYQELKKKGQLKEYCQRQANSAHEVSQNLAERGVSPFEAQQIAKAQFIFPSKADMP